MRPMVLVTGGAGYVGSILVGHLLDRGYRVRVLDMLRHGLTGMLPYWTNPNLEVVVGDVCDEKAVASALKDVDTIVHLAALVGYPRCNKDPFGAVTTNVEGTRTLVEGAQDHQKLIFASTGSVYGAVDGTCSEASALDPLSLYAETKVQAENIVRTKRAAVILRLATAFGASPRMRTDLLPNTFVHDAVSRRSLVVYQRHAMRTFIHVRDIAQAISHCMERWNSVAGASYNVGNESMNISKGDLAGLIGRYVPYDLRFADYAEDADKRDYEVSYAKFSATGYKTTVSLDEGIQELVRVAHILDSAAQIAA